MERQRAGQQVAAPPPSMKEASSRMRTLRHLASAEQSGQSTMRMLDEQGAQLDRISAKQDSAMASLDVSEKQLSIMESLTAWIWGGSTAKRKAPNVSNASEEAAEARSSSSSPAGSGSGATAARAGVAAPREYIEADSWVMLQRGAELRAGVQDEDQAFYGEVQSGVRNLHHMALRIGDTLDAQNRQLQGMHDKGDVLGARVQAANSRINTLLK